MDPTSNSSFLSKNKSIVVYILGIIFLILFWNWANSPMVVTFTGTGKVSAPASNAIISFNIISSDSTAQGAIASVTQRAKTIKEIVKGSGVSEEDIAESQVTAAPAQTGGGYQAGISMAAKTIHVTELSDLITRLYLNGATSVSQPVLSVEDRSGYEAKAVEEAMKDVKKQASLFGSKNLKFIKKIVNVTQQTSGVTSTATSKADAISEASSQDAAANGIFKIVKTLTVSYKMW